MHAIGNRIGDRFEFFGCFEDGRGADGGRCIVKGELIGIDQAEMRGSEVRHGAGGRTDVLGIAGAHEDDDEIFQIRERQAVHFSGICSRDLGTRAAQADNAEWAHILRDFLFHSWIRLI